MTAKSEFEFTRESLKGFSIVPMVTPFTPSGDLDEEGSACLVRHILDGGCQGIMVSGTTGESASMMHSARVRLAQVAVAAGARDGVIFLGIGDNSLERSVELANEGFGAGVDAVVAHLPSYYPIGEREMESWFITLAERVDGPVFLYNIPQTTGHSIPISLIERLSHHPDIHGLKDSEPDAERQKAIASLFADRDDFFYFCGSVAYTNEAMRSGALGFVPAAGNLTPRLMRELMDAYLAKDYEQAERLLNRVRAVSSIFQGGRNLSTSLSALKAGVASLGLCSEHMLLPLLDLDAEEVSAIGSSLKEMEAIA